MKHKVFLNRMRTEIGVIPVLSNFQHVNRPLQIYTAEKHENEGKTSIFFIVRGKDAKKLADLGYEMQSIILKVGNTPSFLNWSTGSILEQTLWY
jgi:hypothetical protein